MGNASNFRESRGMELPFRSTGIRAYTKWACREIVTFMIDLYSSALSVPISAGTYRCAAT